MASPAAYAVFAPKARSIKAQLVQPSLLREILAAESYEEARALLRETPYGERLREEASIEAVQEAAVGVLLSRIYRLARYAPSDSRRLLLAFAREEEIRDALIILRAASEKAGRIPRVPSASHPESIVSRLAREAETAEGVQRLLEALEGSWLKQAARTAHTIAGEARTGEAYTWYATAAGLLEYIEAINTLPQQDRPGVEKILCPIITYKITASLVNAKTLDIPLRALDRIMEKIKTCKFNWKTFKPIYEREVDPESLLATLRDLFPKLKIETKLSRQDALTQARKTALQQARHQAETAYASYPFKPTLTAATGTLIKTEANDIQAALTAKILKLKPEQYETLITTI
ncbi:MAG: V-type ATPase subunit [Desulfurococcales archaeon]|nr:V-type ATPase subunit [Desulfurococcales archaeon]